MSAPTIDVSLTSRIPGFTFDLEWQSDAHVIGIFGPSGSGKTTCLEAIAGLRHQFDGHVRQGDATWLDTRSGILVPPEKRRVGYVPQDHLLFPHWNVRRNLLAAKFPSRSEENSRESRFEEVVDLLGLRPLLDRPVRALSGGESQRVALGRALLADPSLLLLDEPLSSLDGALRARILPYLREVCARFSCPLIVVSHHPQDLLALCDQIVALKAGKVVAQGPPVEVLTRPEVFAHLGTQGFENILPGRFEGSAEGCVRIRLGASPTSSAPVVMALSSETEHSERCFVGIPAHDLLIATEKIHGLSARNSLPAELVEKKVAGSQYLLTTRLSGAGDLPPVVVEVTPEAIRELDLHPGRKVDLIVKSSAVRIYV